MTINENPGSFDEKGYLVVRDVFSPDVVAGLRKAALDALNQQNAKLVCDIVVDYPIFRNLLDNPKLASALTAVLGSPFLVMPPTSIDHNRFGGFHTDTTGMETAGWTFHRKPEFRAVVMGIYLQDNDEYGGGIRVVPGSHREPDFYIDLIREKAEYRASVQGSFIKRTLKRASRGRLFSWQDERSNNVPGQIDLPTRAGDVAMWDMRIVHRASPQRTTGESVPGGKIALFYVLGRDNATTRTWMDYLNQSGELRNVRREGAPLPASTPGHIFL